MLAGSRVTCYGGQRVSNGRIGPRGAIPPAEELVGHGVAHDGFPFPIPLDAGADFEQLE